MMQKKIIFIVLAVMTVLITGIFLFQNKNKPLSQSLEIKDSRKIQIVSVDELAKQPDIYKGIIVVSGIVTKVTSSKSVFILGCKDASSIMPVKYNKQLPKPETKITAIGELEKTKEGKYIFNATDIKNEK